MKNITYTNINEEIDRVSRALRYYNDFEDFDDSYEQKTRILLNLSKTRKELIEGDSLLEQKYPKATFIFKEE